MSLRKRCERLWDKLGQGNSVELIEAFAREIESQTVVQWNEKCYQNGRNAAMEEAAKQFDNPEPHTASAHIARGLRALKTTALAKEPEGPDRRYDLHDRLIKAGEENAKLRKVVDAAQAFMNEIQCYSTGTSLMAEEDMVELFAKYSDAKDELDSKDSE